MIPIWSAEERAAAREQIEGLSGLVQAEVEATEEPAGASAHPLIGPAQRQVRILQRFLDRADAAADAPLRSHPVDTASRIFADAVTHLGVDPLDQEQVDSLTV